MNRTVARTLKILNYISECEQPVTLTQICGEMDIPFSSAYDILNTLLQMDYLRMQDKNAKTYSIGINTFKTGMKYIKGVDILEVSKPVLQYMSREACATTFLVTRYGKNIVYLAKVESQGPVKTTAQLGSSKGMYYTGVGKALLATMELEEVEQMYCDEVFVKHTPKTICDMEHLKRELLEIRERGYAIDDCEGENSVYCIAAPIRNYEGEAIAAISIADFKEHIKETNMDNTSLLTNSALNISNKMGYIGKTLY